MEAGALSNPVLRARRNRTDRIGDPLLRGLSGLAAALAVAVVVGIVYEVIHIASPAISAFGIGFVTTNDWNPVTENFGAAPFLYGTVVTSAIALLFAAPLSIAISIYLTELAPSRLRRPVATLVDMLAAIPTVILGLWGILVLGPVMHDTIEPALQSVLGFLPIFSGDPSAFGYLTAAVILTIMVTPINNWAITIGAPSGAELRRKRRPTSNATPTKLARHASRASREPEKRACRFARSARRRAFIGRR